MMIKSLELLLAWRYLRTRRQEGLISVITVFSFLGIVLGVATLIVVMSVMTGFRDRLLDQIVAFSGHIKVEREAGFTSDHIYQIRDQVLAIDDVKKVTPLLEEQVMLTANGAAKAAIVRGVEPEAISNQSQLASGLLDGDLADLKRWDIVLPLRLARKLDVVVGDEVELVSAKGVFTAFGWTPRIREFTVVAIVQTGRGKGFSYMPLEAAQIFFQQKESLNSIEIRVEKNDLIAPVAERLKQIWSDQPDIKVLTWRSLNPTLVSALEIERAVMFLILLLIVLVAAFNIISGQILLVRDKTKGIAILRTMGMGRLSVLKIFLLSGSSIGVIGTLIGVALGVVIAINLAPMADLLSFYVGEGPLQSQLYYISTLPNQLRLEHLLGIAGIALSVSVLATIYPAWRAARLDPVEILRYS